MLYRFEEKLPVAAEDMKSSAATLARFDLVDAAPAAVIAAAGRPPLAAIGSARSLVLRL